MVLRGLFKPHKNKTYDYTPRYYNARKERLENLMKAKEAKSDEDYIKGYRRKTFREDWRTKKSQSMDVNRRLRLMVIVIFLFIFAYAAMKYGKLDFLL
ncbi:hypothetical protein B7P33_06625 [Sediminicola luteus]|uniref:Riboflavin synthase subunit beta n=2 Tax=Sediminicola luteus TaxID=319238 RepID=A0A2A4GAQ8_9FLAO|nr:hypothetical protein B7P33_06625 [Sediminicola luteus]